MSGRKARQWREATAVLEQATPCDCGSYPHDFLTPCAFLAWCSRTTENGRCHQCGARLIRRLGWDPSMACVVRLTRCPKHCQRSQQWVRPEHATKAERDYLGLILAAADPVLPARDETREP